MIEAMISVGTLTIVTVLLADFAEGFGINNCQPLPCNVGTPNPWMPPPIQTPPKRHPGWYYHRIPTTQAPAVCPTPAPTPCPTPAPTCPPCPTPAPTPAPLPENLCRIAGGTCLVECDVGTLTVEVVLPCTSLGERCCFPPSG